MSISHAASLPKSMLKLGAICLLATSAAVHAGEWKDTPQPLLEKGEGSASIHLGYPCVLVDGGGLRMWYQGYWGKQDICLAESKDGKTWSTYSGGSPVLKGVGTELLLSAPCVLKGQNAYSMWYTFNDKWSEAGWSLGYATSTDGIRWERYKGNPVLTPSTSGDDDGAIEVPCVRMKNGHYFMWYQAHKKGDWKQQLFYATSDNGVEWKRQGVITFDKAFPSLLLQPCVVADGDGWRMFFVYTDGQKEISVLYCATSKDGASWTIDTTVPTKPLVSCPSVMVEGNKYRLWYAADDAIHYAEFVR